MTRPHLLSSALAASPASRVGLYARYSDPVQNPRSCQDQFDLLGARAVQRGWTTVAQFADPEISGYAMANRPGLLAALAAAEAGAFDVLLVEHQDRLVRNLEHAAHIYNRLRDCGVRISTLSTDEVTLLNVAFDGYQGEDYLIQLGHKTRRGMRSNAEKGLATGARIYGYASQPGGRMAIVPDQAAIVVEIFDRYAGRDGYAPESLRAITADLNARGVPSPSGGRWSPSTITGSRQRGNGILRQELYRGVKTWNRFRMGKDRATGRRTSTPVPPAEWKRTPVPELRIVSDAAWDACNGKVAAAGEASPAQRRTNPPTLLSGLVRCAGCGAAMVAFNSRGRLICGARRAHGPTACDNGLSVPRREIEARVLAGLRTRLLSPQAVSAYVRAYHERWRQRQAQAARDTAPLARRVGELERAITRTADAIVAAGHSDALIARLRTLEAEKAEADAALARATADQDSAPVVLHPSAPADYARRIALIEDHLARHGLRAAAHDAASAETLRTLRALVQRVEVRALPVALDDARGKAPVSIKLFGTLAAFLRPEGDTRAMPPLPSDPRLTKLVAGGGFKLDQTPAPTLAIAC